MLTPLSPTPPAPPAADDDDPPPILQSRDLMGVIGLLRRRGYGYDQVLRICQHVKWFATAQCCRDLAQNDVDEVERMLPGNPYNWASEWDEWTYEPGPEV